MPRFLAESLGKHYEKDLPTEQLFSGLALPKALRNAGSSFRNAVYVTTAGSPNQLIAPPKALLLVEKGHQIPL
ncbi:hypothetical protein D9613_009650 [Agrocybe pediades]|uniref:Uncharacterized protein n=1 Tax=Agrocybe pediades TaxID=84607 RepID=A0A8H4VSZ6_9AGAR|nr:hypothetical protein D9613_009650 [Agrocybe pediades]